MVLPLLGRWLGVAGAVVAIAAGSLLIPGHLVTSTAAASTPAHISSTSARTSSATAAATALPSKQECVYSALQISILNSFDRMIGRQLNCAQVFANTPANWEQFENPWFVNYYNDANLDWSAWATTKARTTRKLVITLNLFPSSLQKRNWLSAGAAGDYAKYDKVLAQHLVAAGLGNSIIRLAPEMNGNWYDYSLGTSRSAWAKWDRFWDRTVTAMRSVPGAHFAFDWCIDIGYRPLPLSEIYPGNKYVNIVGMDVYDVGKLGSTPAQRWHTTYTEPDGVKAVISFAHSRSKPLSIPEWGIAPTKWAGGGDNATFVNGIASVVRNNPVVYESYFFKEDYRSELTGGSKALAAYRRHFGAHGDAVNSGNDLWSSARR